MPNSEKESKIVTIIYYSNNSLELLHDIKSLVQDPNGRIVIPKNYKKGKSIIAVCEGEINIINRLGDRILTVDNVA